MKTQLSQTLKEYYQSGGTRDALAAQLRVGLHTVRAWERGAQLPDAVTFDRLIDHLGIDHRTEHYWQLKQETEQWNAADHSRSLPIEVLLFVVLLPTFYLFLARFLTQLIYLPPFSLQTTLALEWAAWFLTLILSPSLAYLLCGPLSTKILRIFKK